MCCITVTNVITFDMKYFLTKVCKMEENGRKNIAQFSRRFELGGKSFGVGGEEKTKNLRQRCDLKTLKVRMSFWKKFEIWAF